MLPSEYIRRGWCQGYHAKSVNGRKCDLDSPKVGQVDLIGALMLSKDAPEYKYRLVAQAIDDDRKRRFQECEDINSLSVEDYRELTRPAATITEWQDQPYRTQDDVLRVLRSVGL